MDWAGPSRTTSRPAWSVRTIWPSAWPALSAGALPEADTLPDAELPAPPEQAAQARAMDRASARAAIRFHVLCFKRFTPSGWF